MTGELSEDELKKHKMTQEFKDHTQRLIGLFYDENSKERQEIIDLPPYDVQPMISLDLKLTVKLAKESLLMDSEVASNLIKILTQDDKETLERSQINT